MLVTWRQQVGDEFSVGNVGTASLASTNLLALDRVSAAHGVGVEHSRRHARHDNHEHGQRFQKACHYAASLGVADGFRSQGTLNNNLHSIKLITSISNSSENV